MAQQQGRIVEVQEFDIRRHQTWVDHRMWFEDRERRDREREQIAVNTQNHSNAGN